MRLLHKASSLFNELINFSTSLVSGIYVILRIQVTKISKEDHYYIRTNLEEIKKSKKKKSARATKFAATAKFRNGCEIYRVG